MTAMRSVIISLALFLVVNLPATSATAEAVSSLEEIYEILSEGEVIESNMEGDTAYFVVVHKNVLYLCRVYAVDAERIIRPC